NTVDYRRAIHGPSIGFTRSHIDVAVHPGHGQFASSLQPAVSSPDDLLRMETHQRVVGQVLEPMAEEFPVFVDDTGHGSSSVDSEIDAGLRRITVVDSQYSVDPGVAEGYVDFRFSIIGRSVGGKLRVGMTSVHLPGSGRGIRFSGTAQAEDA